jgi:hypothetical protein
VNPEIVGIAVMSASLELHVFASCANVGVAGKMTRLTALLGPQDPLPAVPAAVAPQADEVTYLAVIVWQPGVVGMVGEVV